ncbi:MAG TPA: hypothetical protein VIH40_14295 [Xanthobacteraceae bacterium]
MKALRAEHKFTLGASARTLVGAPTNRRLQFSRTHIEVEYG